MKRTILFTLLLGVQCSMFNVQCKKTHNSTLYSPPNWEGTGKGLNYFTMSQRLFRLMVQKNAALNIELYKPDILVNIPMDLFGPFEYDHVDKISAYGREKMREALKNIEH